MKFEFDFKTEVKYTVKVDGGDKQTHEDVLDDVY